MFAVFFFLSCRTPKYTNAYLKVLNGVSSEILHEAGKDKDLSIEEQVQCLEDIATDKYVLGVAYIGYRPWL